MKQDSRGKPEHEPQSRKADDRKVTGKQGNVNQVFHVASHRVPSPKLSKS